MKFREYREFHDNWDACVYDATLKNPTLFRASMSAAKRGRSSGCLDQHWIMMPYTDCGQRIGRVSSRPSARFAAICTINHSILCVLIIDIQVQLHILHSDPKNAHLFHMTVFSTKLTDFCNIWHTVYTVLTCNTIIIYLPTSPTYCCYTTLGNKSSAE